MIFLRHVVTSIGMALGMLASASIQAENYDGFHVSQLPKGAEVTIPSRSMTVVPLKSRVMFTATDSPQTLKFSTGRASGQKSLPIRVQVFDRNQDRVKYLDLRPGLPFLYKFQGLSSIYIIPRPIASHPNVQDVRLEVTSDKPLQISH